MANLDREARTTLDEARINILEALRSLRFGAIELQVHDFRIVRITRTEKLRMSPRLSSEEPG